MAMTAISCHNSRTQATQAKKRGGGGGGRGFGFRGAGNKSQEKKQHFDWVREGYLNNFTYL